jgi:hypothetical protein
MNRVQKTRFFLFVPFENRLILFGLLIFVQIFSMDSFIRRLKYYGIGFGIGLIFVLFFFQNRGCSWLPGNRVKNSVLDRVLVVSDEEAAKLKSFGIGEEELVNVLNDGKVLFKESKKEGNPQVYVIENEVNGKAHRFYFTLPKESFISEVKIGAQNASAVRNSTQGMGNIIRYPNDENLIFVDSSKVLGCQQAALGVISTTELFKIWKKSARIDFSKSDLKRSPKPEHYIEYKDNKGRWIGTSSVWYKTKISISSFEIPFDTGCE